MTESQRVLQVIGEVLDGIRRSLNKEGADIDVVVDEAGRRIIVQLVRQRIVCEGCLLTQDQVQRRIARKLASADGELAYSVETRWD